MPSEPYRLLEPGALFHGRYRIDHCIKAGGMGAVYEVIDEKTDSRRALKVMLPSLVDDADLRARFELEARITGKIESDHLARVSDAGVDEASGMPFLVMDLLKGEELGSMLARRRLLPPGEVVLYLFEAALALDRTHAAAIIHRDLKPENLFVTRRDDGSPCIKVFDFGIAKVVSRDNARATRAIGTPLYMSPEQIRGDAGLGPPADLYALGQIAYTLLVGEPYWSEEVENGSSLFATLSTIMVGPKEPPSARARRRRGVSLPPAFDAWFLKATAILPADRFGRATDAVAALAIALGVSLPRVGLTVEPLPGAADAAAPAAPATPQGATVPLTTPPPGVLAGRPQIAPTEQMGAAITSRPPAPRPRRAPFIAGAAAVAAVAAVVAAVLALRPAPSPREGAAPPVPALTSAPAPPPAIELAPPEPPAQPPATEPATAEATAPPPASASASAPAQLPDAGPPAAPARRPDAKPPAPTPRHEGIF